MTTRYITPDYRADNRRIVAVDGEGNDVDGRHAYTLLAAADDRGFRAHVRHDGSTRPGTAREDVSHCPWRPLTPGELPHSCERCYRPTDTGPNHGLPTVDCLEFLLALPQNPSDLIIAFSFTYDVTKILHDIEWQNFVELRTSGMTTWNGYTIREMPRKFFEIRHGDRRVKVWDTFSYWQMSFVAALEKSKSLFTPEQQAVIDFIKMMKGERAHLERQTPEEVLRYCFSECEFLAIMYRDFLAQCESDAVDLQLRAHSGPGALAEQFFMREKIARHMPPAGTQPVGIPESVPQMSYYGGRFETTRLGTVGNVYQYDIHSAYPAMAVTLPCLSCGYFKEVSDYDPQHEFGFYFVGSKTEGSPWAPFPFRSDGSKEHKRRLNLADKGSIAFVHGGRRWVTSFELAVARKHFTAEQTPVFAGYVYVPGCTHLPFAHVADLYDERQRIKRAIKAAKSQGDDAGVSEGLEKVLKLLINSIYGKTAQSTGIRVDPRTPHHASQKEAYSFPKYQCYSWASWMTGGTRAKVLDAALMGGEDVVSIATDGILCTRTIDDGLEVHDFKLGAWEREDKPDAWLGMPGIYAFGSTGKGKAPEFKRRGLDGRYFPAEYLRSKWANGDWKVEARCIPCEGEGKDCSECGGTGKGEARAFMPTRLALMRTNALDTLGEWVPMPKTVNFASIVKKRHMILPDDNFMPGAMRHTGDTIELFPITVPDDYVSAPYNPKVTWEKLYMLSLMDEAITEEFLGDVVGDLDMPMWDETDVEDWK